MNTKKPISDRGPGRPRMPKRFRRKRICLNLHLDTINALHFLKARSKMKSYSIGVDALVMAEYHRWYKPTVLDTEYRELMYLCDYAKDIEDFNFANGLFKRMQQIQLIQKGYNPCDIYL